MSTGNIETIPNIWGRGLIFAFSGMDGETSWAEPFILSGEEPLAFKVQGPGKTQSRIRFRFDGMADENVQFHIVTGDVVRATAAHGANLDLAWVDRRTLGGAFTAGSRIAGMEIRLEGAWEKAGGSLQGVASKEAPFFFTADQAVGIDLNKDAATVRLAVDTGHHIRFAFTLGTLVDPREIALDEAIRRGETFAASIPPAQWDRLNLSGGIALERAYRKCVTVMKVNCMTAENQIARNWTTPDRVPHRHMWIWDSAFHAEGLKYINKPWAEDAILAVFTKQRPDGFIPHTMTPDGSQDSDRIQPPILGASALNVYRVTGNRELLRSVYEPNARFLDWIENHMDGDGNGLTEWKKGGTESGMDNSPRFEFGEPFDALDLNCFVANDWAALAEIGNILGDKRADNYKQRALALAEKIRQWFWHPERKFFFDRKPDGTFIFVKTPCAFLPLWAGIATVEQAKNVVAALLDPKQFWTPMPTPCVGLDDPTYEKDMWRGPSWVNYNYFTVHGLTRYGYAEEALELARRNVKEVARWYEEDGVIYEFYDAEAEISPCRLNRKGSRGGHWLHIVIPDYNFTASLIVALANGDIGQKSGPMKY